MPFPQSQLCSVSCFVWRAWNKFRTHNLSEPVFVARIVHTPNRFCYILRGAPRNVKRIQLRHPSADFGFKTRSCQHNQARTCDYRSPMVEADLGVAQAHKIPEDHGQQDPPLHHAEGRERRRVEWRESRDDGGEPTRVNYPHFQRNYPRPARSRKIVLSAKKIEPRSSGTPSWYHLFCPSAERDRAAGGILHLRCYLVGGDVVMMRDSTCSAGKIKPTRSPKRVSVRSLDSAYPARSACVWIPSYVYPV